MCFTPWVSLVTALIEIIIATFILVRYKNYVVPVFSAILIYVLGLYQFSEFMLCYSGNAVLWATIGFAVYTFLPAVGLHMTFRFMKIRFPKWILYVLPVGFSLFALLKGGFISRASCFKVFVVVKSVLFAEGNNFFTTIYILYYFGFIAVMLFLLFRHLNDRDLSRIYLLWLIVGIVTLAAPIFLIVIFPTLHAAFPSVYCEFGLGFTIAAVAGSEVYSRKRKKEKF
jgi:hypothetical protein